MGEMVLHPELVDHIPGGLYVAGDVRLSVCIMGHERRQQMIAALVDTLTSQGITPALSIDRQPVHIGQRRRTYSLWTNAESAWGHVPGGATHHCVIQDDAQPCADLVPTLARLAALKPAEVIVPYCEYPTITQARDAGEAWMLHSRGVAGLCSVWPVNVLRDALAWIAEHISLDYWMDDGRFNAYLQAHGRNAWLTAPSLVDHLCPLRKQSLRQHGSEDRTAAWYIGQGRGLDVDWLRGADGPSVRMDGFAPLWDGVLGDYWMGEKPSGG